MLGKTHLFFGNLGKLYYSFFGQNKVRLLPLGNIGHSVLFPPSEAIPVKRYKKKPLSTNKQQKVNKMITPIIASYTLSPKLILAVLVHFIRLQRFPKIRNQRRSVPIFEDKTPRHSTATCLRAPMNTPHNIEAMIRK